MHVTPDDGMIFLIVVRLISLLALRIRGRARSEERSVTILVIPHSLLLGELAQEGYVNGTRINVVWRDVRDERGSDG
jgi:hypothetical protein